MGKRRKARETALQALFQVDFHGPDYRESLDIFWKQQSLPSDSMEFANALVQGVISNMEDIDALIEAHSDHWKISRMSRVDRNILRLATRELTSFEEIPFKVTIDEAIELAKKFGTGESGAFINGILDHISRKIKG